MPNAGRGRAEPPLPLQCVASLIIAVLAAERIADAADVVHIYGALGPRIESGADGPKVKHRNLQDALTQIFLVSAVDEPEARKAAESIIEFAVDRRQPQAYITTRIPRRGPWKQVYVAKGWQYDPGRLQEWVTLPGATLRALVAEAVDDAPARWARTG